MSTPQDPGDVPFQHYTTKHRIIAWISLNLFDNVTYTVRHGLNQGMKRKGGLGWVPVLSAGASATPEHAFWAGLDLRDLVIYDVGAFHGLLTMFFAKQGRQVISYEPNSKNHKRLLENLKLNNITNVTVRKTGVGASTGSATMMVSPLMQGGASIDNSTVSGLKNANVPVQSEEIPVTTLDDDIRDSSLPAPQFIKIDIEGFELQALQGARNTLLTHRPRLFLEMHGDTMNLKRKKVLDIVTYLKEIGYGKIRHVETGTEIGVSNSAAAAEGHLYCEWK